MSIIRDITNTSRQYWDTNEVLLFVGARQVGKTTILKQIRDELEDRGETTFWLNLEDPEYLAELNKTPRNLFKIFPIDTTKRAVIFIDEIQYLKDPTNVLKYLYDEHGEYLKLIVSGSSAFYINESFRDSLAGRKRIFHVRSLSFLEFLRFQKEDELAKKDFSTLSLEEARKISDYYHQYLLYGGYPRVVLAKGEEKIEVLRDLAYSYIKKDVLEAQIRREDVFYKLMKILASQAGNLINISELSNTLQISIATVEHYLLVLQKSFHVALIRPFSNNVRSELTKMPKAYWYDGGLRNFFADTFESLLTRSDKGVVLENATFRQLIESNEVEDIHFWRTVSGREVDFVVGRNAYEVKTNPSAFKRNKYQVFQGLYPEIPLSVVAIDKENDTVDTIPVLNVWEL